MKRPGRLMSAKSWLPTYNGNHIVKGYCKRYGVDLPCALIELELLGIVLAPEYIKAVKQSIEGEMQARKRRKIEKQEELEGVYGLDYDDDFSYIVGFTSGGAPYGVPWESDDI